jgi:hypothetical protein
MSGPPAVASDNLPTNQPLRFWGGLCMGKRFGFILGWFAGLFLFNVVVHQNPLATDPLIYRLLAGVEYMASPVELIISLLVVILILYLTAK